MPVERARKAIPSKISRKLWLKSGGRCQYEGCNKSLWKDSLTQRQMNKGYISHIVASSKDGSRGHNILSPKLQTDYSNLMLLCDECHNRIDKAQVTEHPVERLLEMKKAHEYRIELLTGLKAENRSHMLFYGAKIGQQDSPLMFGETVSAILPHRFPVSDTPVELGIKNTSYIDHSPEYWNYQVEELISGFNLEMERLKKGHNVKHYSVFAMGPQPLLIKLGTLLGDIYSADVYQRHREPSSWIWQSDSSVSDFKLVEPANKTGIPVLLFSLSADIPDERVKVVIGDNCSIWRITIDSPNNDFLKTKELLQKFRVICRLAFGKINTIYGQTQQLHIFPAMPISAAVEVGRVWMPKADPPMILYDYNSKATAFVRTFEIKNPL